MASRACNSSKRDGSPCGAPPLRESDFCLMHDPAHADDVQEGRRLGGQRRRREVIVSNAYDFDGLGSVEQIRRLVEIAVVDTLGLDNSIARARTLAYLAQSATKLLEVGELEQRLERVEGALGPRLQKGRR